MTSTSKNCQSHENLVKIERVSLSRGKLDAMWWRLDLETEKHINGKTGENPSKVQLIVIKQSCFFSFYN